MLDPHDTRSLARLYGAESAVEFEFLMIDEGLDASKRAMKLYRSLGDKILWARSATGYTRYLRMRGRHAEAGSLGNQIRKLAIARPEEPALTEALWGIAVVCYLPLEPLVARELFRTGMRRPGITKLQRQRYLNFLAAAECVCGDLAAALACQTTLPLFQGRIALRLGDWERALTLMREQYDLANAAGSKSALLDSICSIFVSLYLIGDHAAASAMLPQLLETHGITEPHFQMRTHPYAALLALESGRIDEASEHLKRCHKILELGEDWRGAAGLVVRADAALAAAQNRFDEAGVLFAESIKISQEFGLV
jgi:tetratricopeptide (TPR) repeat protein